jgi:hypothetical protein
MSGNDNRRVTLVPEPLADGLVEPDDESPPADPVVPREPVVPAEPVVAEEPSAPEPAVPDRADPPSVATFARPDPFAAAQAALARAREARGVAPEEVVRPVSTEDPLAAAHAALERAREARREREPTAERRLADALAEAQLRRLRRVLDEDDPTG